MARDQPSGSSGIPFEERYLLLDPLREGGFGTVYKARQLATDQLVAVKLMRSAERGGSSEELARCAALFRREALLCAELYHPNIVRLVDSGQTSAGLFYSVFSLVPGRTLAEVLADKGALAPEEARHLMLQVLDALSCAHSHGVVHRDIKPRNLMIVETGARRNALVLDFGIGALCESSEGARVELEASLAASEPLGTPGYAAPEQLRGLSPTPRADLFSWGLVFLECLTGRPVLAGSSVSEILCEQFSPTPISLPSALREHPLGELLRRATRKDVAAREVTAPGLLQELAACDLRTLSRQALVGGSLVPAELPSSHARSTSLAPQDSSGAPAVVGARLLEGERRQLTVVCALLEPLVPGGVDPEETDELLRVQRSLCAEVASQHRGHLAASLGDQVLLCFGHPHAEEDDAIRAARATLALVAATGARSALIEAERGARLGIRVGMHTGLVAQQAGDSVALGATPRLATRLAALAEPGAILLSMETWGLVRGRFTAEAQGEHRLDGLSAPLVIHRLQSERAISPSASQPRHRDVALAGRKQELAVLLERWQRTHAGAGQVCLVTGEPGIGKSRLVRELRARLPAEPLLWLDCHCAPESRNNALYPIIHLLNRMLSLGAAEGVGDSADRLSALLSRYGCSPEKLVPLLAPLLGLPLDERYPPPELSPQRQRQETLGAILSLLFAMSARTPVVLVIEDLHWADPTTLELLSRLVIDAPTAHVCVLLTARPEFSPSFSDAGVLYLPLLRLQQDDAGVIVGQLTGSAPLPPRVLDQVLQRAEGVPLFIEELTQAVIEAGALMKGGEVDPLVSAIPMTLLGLLSARLDRLGRAKETAQVAAAIGRDFSLDLLFAVSSLDRAEVQEDLDRLHAAGLIQRRPRSGTSACVFKHALIRDAAYGSLLKRSRQRIHSRIAAALEERFPELVRGRPDLLAQHHAAAEQKRQAIRYALQAATEALQRSANTEAISFARETLGWLNAAGLASAISDMRERAEVELALNGIITPALMATRGWAAPEIKPVVDRSQALLDILGDGPFVSPTLWALSLYHHVGGRERQRGKELAERMLALAGRSHEAGAEAAAHSILGHTALLDGRFVAAREHLECSLASCRSAGQPGLHAVYGHDIEAWARSTLAEVLCLSGQPERSLSLGLASLARSRELRHAGTTAIVLLFQTLLHYHRREREKVLEYSGALLELTERHGLPTQMGYAGVVRGWALRDVAGAERSFSNLEMLGAEVALPFYGAVIAETEALCGRPAEALARLERSMVLAEERGERYYLSEMNRHKGVLLLEAGGPGRDEEAEACFRQALSLAQAQGMWSVALPAATALGKLLAERGRGDEARELLSPLCDPLPTEVEASLAAEVRAQLAKLGR